MDQALDPAYLQRRRRIRMLAGALVLACLAGAAWGVNRALRPSLDAADIVISTVRRGDVANTVNAAGIVIPVHEEVVASPAASQVAKVHAKPGQQVAQGELLLELAQPHNRLLRNKMRVDVNIVTAQKSGVLVIDSGAAFNGSGRQHAFAVVDGMARRTRLQLGSSDGKLVEVVSGAKPGERYIVSDTRAYAQQDSIRISD